MKSFGGNWTKIKMEIVVKYAKAYLTIMGKYPYFKTLYFDALAGSGEIPKESEDSLKGTALKILEIDDPKSFDIYYFVDKDKTAIEQLESVIKPKYPKKSIYCVHEDCNKKIKDLGEFLRSSKGNNVKVLGYFDPFGMQINWDSMESLSKLGVDVWLLFPSGIGVNRMLTKTGEIAPSWEKKLERFLGLDIEEIKSKFYHEKPQIDLWGNSEIEKTRKPIDKILSLYKERLTEIFKYSSNPFALKNQSNSTMYHFMLITNNRVAVGIANDIIKKY